MVKEILTKCGYRCDLCLAYKENIDKNDQRVFLSDTWHKIYGFRIHAHEICCEGCISSHNPVLIDSGCPVRPCVSDKGLENCSQCDDYPCDTFNQRKVVYETLAKNIDVSGKEYTKCIKPYENVIRLNAKRRENYPDSRLLNPEMVPDNERMIKFIDNDKVIDAWNTILYFIDDNYDLERKILFNGRKYGWAIQYKRGKKTIITLYPERRNFTILFIFGRSEIEAIMKNRNAFSESTFETIEKTKQLHDGRWVTFRYKDKGLIDDIIKLIKIKRKPITK